MLISGNGKVITGEGWSYCSPRIYDFQYFKFEKCAGGHANIPASLSVAFEASNTKFILSKILELLKDNQVSSLSHREIALNTVQLKIEYYTLYDFDMLFALKIEEILKKEIIGGNAIISKIDSSKEKWISSFTRKQEGLVRFKESKIRWVGSDCDELTGVSASRVRVDMHCDNHSNIEQFFAALKLLLDECNIEHAWYYSYLDHYMLFIGNGRQGASNKDVIYSDWEKFSNDFITLAKKFEFYFGFKKSFSSYEVSSDKYNKLISQSQVVIKDERFVHSHNKSFKRTKNSWLLLLRRLF